MSEIREKVAPIRSAGPVERVAFVPERGPHRPRRVNRASTPERKFLSIIHHFLLGPTVLKKYNVLNIPLAETSIPRIMNDVFTNHKKNHIVTATGAHGIITARKDNLLYKILTDRNTINLPDGKPGVWIAKMKGAKNIQRCFGPFVFAEVMKKTAKTDTKHFFAGGKPCVAEQLKENVAKRFGNENVVGTHCPPFRNLSDEDFKDLANKINELNVDIVWIGISTPKQEKFAYNLTRYTNVKFLVTVGAAFDYHTDTIRPAPNWVQEAGLEWLFRLLMEPKRLWKRYFKIVPLFIWYNIIELIKGEFLKTKVKEK